MRTCNFIIVIATQLVNTIKKCFLLQSYFYIIVNYNYMVCLKCEYYSFYWRGRCVGLLIKDLYPV
ncbi:hypothetical protein JN06_00940 [Bacteroides zoogleoformans]|nr:hypothetical protein JN06_00940 [Bacteroides zoogleoformans]